MIVCACRRKKDGWFVERSRKDQRPGKRRTQKLGVQVTITMNYRVE